MKPDRNRDGSRSRELEAAGLDPLPIAMPAWAPRSLAWFLSLLFAAGLLAGFLVPFSRTVRGAFVLVPAAGAAAVLSPVAGFVEDVFAEEGSMLRKGDVLLTVRAAIDGAARGENPGRVEVRSPADGVLCRRMRLQPGDRVDAGRPIAQIAESGKAIAAEIDLPENSLPSLAPGQKVRLLFAAYPRHAFGVREGTIERVNAVPVRVGERYVAKAFAALDSASIEAGGEERPLLAGLRGEALVIVDRRPLLAGFGARGGSR